MIGYVYSTERDEIVAEIHGEDNAAIEAAAEERGWMGCDEFGLTYTRGQMAFEMGHDFIEV